MDIGINSFFKSLFGKRALKEIEAISAVDELVSEISIKEAASHACINLIANAIANCDIRVYENGKAKKNSIWYKLNVQPNVNQSSKAFWQKLIHRLYEKNEALVVEQGGDLYVADAFTKNDQYAFYPHSYEGVMIGNYQYSYNLPEDKVWYFKLHDAPIKRMTDGIATLYSQLISAFVNSYKNAKGTKGILYIDQVAENSENFDETFSNLTSKSFKSFLENNDAIVPLFEGFRYEQVANSLGPSGDSSEVRSQVQAVFETYAMAFGIPKHLITGDVQDTTEAIEFFLTFTLDPLVKLLEAEINRKLFSEQENLSGTYIKFKTNEIKHVDILTIANNIEKLISSGAMTINEVRNATGLDKVDEAFANRFAMTKNFADVSDVLKPLERRETDETGNNSQTSG